MLTAGRIGKLVAIKGNVHDSKLLVEENFQSSRKLHIGGKYMDNERKQKKKGKKLLNGISGRGGSNLWHDLDTAVHSPYDLAELEKFCIEEWNKLPKSKCSKVI